MYDKYQGLIFDMDGTLLDTELSNYKAWYNVIDTYGISLDKYLISSLKGSPTLYIAKVIIDKYNLDIDPKFLVMKKKNILKKIIFEHATTLPFIEVVKKYYEKKK